MSARHPFLDHLDRAATLEAVHPQPLWTPEHGPLPSLYLSHGAPPVFEDTGWMTRLHYWARSLPRPRAILVVSAHWESAPLAVTSTQPTPLRPASWPRGCGECCPTPRRCTSTPAGAWTTAPGCRSR